MDIISALSPHYSTITKPLNHLLRKDTIFTWEDAQESAFIQLKTLLATAPELTYADFNQDFFMYTDASGVGLGVGLMQLDARNKLQPVAYAGRTPNPAKLKYSTTHKETLAVVWSLRHFKDLIYGYPIYVKTDHAAVAELFNSKHLSSKLARWSLIVQDFNLSFSYLPRKANVVADALSRHIGTL